MNTSAWTHAWFRLQVAGSILGFAVRLSAMENGPAAPAPREAVELFRVGHAAEARAAFERISAADPNNAEAAFYLGWLAFRRDAPEEAVRLLEKATALDPTRSLYFHILGDAYGVSAQRASMLAKFGLAKKCIAAYDQGVAVNPDNLEVRMARYHYYRDAPAFIGGGMDKARGEAEAIRQRDPLLGTPLVIELYLKERKYDEAFAFVDRLIRKYPGNKFYLFQLGRLSATTGRWLERGEAALVACLVSTPAAREPPQWTAQCRLGQIREKRGAKVAACAAHEAALKLEPNCAEAREALQRLE